MGKGVCGTLGCSLPDFHVGLHEFEIPNRCAKRCEYVDYGHASKVMQRAAFSSMCLELMDTHPDLSILYLDSPSGGATAQFLALGFPPARLSPCNYDKTALVAIQRRFAGVSCEFGDIMDVHKKRRWLGVWFDMEETWSCRITKRWKTSRLPIFSKACVVAVTLSARGISGGAEKFANDLQHLLQQRGGYTPELARAVDGKAGSMTMVFGLALFGRKHLLPRPEAGNAVRNSAERDAVRNSAERIAVRNSVCERIAVRESLAVRNSAERDAVRDILAVRNAAERKAILSAVRNAVDTEGWKFGRSPSHRSDRRGVQKGGNGDAYRQGKKTRNREEEMSFFL